MKTRWQVWTKEVYGGWIQSGPLCKNGAEAALLIKKLGAASPQLKAVALVDGEHPALKGY